MFGRKRIAEPAVATRDVKEGKRTKSPAREGIVYFLGRIDLLIYFLVAVAFVLAAGLALLYSMANIIAQFPHAWLPLPLDRPDLNILAQTILQFVSDLLLVLIIMEVLSTIKSTIENEGTRIEPFLIIGIISATRGILSIGARLSVTGETVTGTPFYNDMIELGVDALIIIALGIILRITQSRTRPTGKVDQTALGDDEATME